MRSLCLKIDGRGFASSSALGPPNSDEAARTRLAVVTTDARCCSSSPWNTEGRALSSRGTCCTWGAAMGQNSENRDLRGWAEAPVGPLAVRRGSGASLDGLLLQDGPPLVGGVED